MWLAGVEGVWWGLLGAKAPPRVPGEFPGGLGGFQGAFWGVLLPLAVTSYLGVDGDLLRTLFLKSLRFRRLVEVSLRSGNRQF